MSYKFIRAASKSLIAFVYHNLALYSVTPSLFNRYEWKCKLFNVAIGQKSFFIQQQMKDYKL